MDNKYKATPVPYRMSPVSTIGSPISYRLGISSRRASWTLTAEDVGQRLAGHFDTLDHVAAEAGLSAHARDKLAKARRVLDSMQATIAFFWTMVASRLAAWGYHPTVQRWMQQDLIPAYYLCRIAEEARTAEEKQRLRILAAEVLARARSPDGLWGTLPGDLQADLESKARQCADFFQRSSSCVEGRNGQLSLRHHALHPLTARKLQALFYASIPPKNTSTVC